MMLTIAPGVFDRFPDMRVAVVHASGFDNRQTSPAIAERWRRAWQAAGKDARRYPNVQSHPRVRPWREAWQRIGVSGKKFPSSIEAMLRRAAKGGEPFAINPLVDLYNAISLEFVVPAGGFDLGHIRGNFELRLTTADDAFQALDDDEPAPVPPGEVAYMAGSKVLTRHFVWRQSKIGLITVDTNDALLVSEVLAELPRGVVEEVEHALADGVRDLMGGEVESMILDAERPAFAG